MRSRGRSGVTRMRDAWLRASSRRARDAVTFALIVAVALAVLWQPSGERHASAASPSKLDPFAQMLLRAAQPRGAEGLSPQAVAEGWTVRSVAPELPNRGARDLGVPGLAGASTPVQLLVQTAASDAELEALGATVVARVGPVVAVSGSVATIAALDGSPRVTYIEMARQMSPSNDVSTAEMGADAAAAGYGVDGAGVVVGIIDSGLDIFHGDFRNADGTTRVKALLNATDADPANWTQYTEAQINAELGAAGSAVPARDTNGHGTHVAGSAAGNGQSSASPYSGVAPASDLIIVQSNLLTTSILTGLSFIDTQAALIGEPWVTNMSFGGELGPHDGTTPLEVAIDAVTGPAVPGQAVVIAAGNSRQSAIHASGMVAQSDPTAPVTVAPAISVSTGATAALADFWYDGGDIFRFGFAAPLGGGFPAAADTFPLNSFVTVCAVVTGGQNCLDILHVTATQNGDNHVFALIYATGTASLLPGVWTFQLEGSAVTNGRFDGWSELAEWVALADPSMRTGSPGNAQHAVTVGAYVTSGSPGQTVGDLATFSSDGPTRDGRLKPEITAPGSVIVSSRSGDAPGFGTPFDASYTGASGTSMSTPHITGTLALLFEVDPTLTSVDVRTILMNSARSDAFTVPSLPNSLWGAGKVDVLGAVSSIAGTITVSKVVVNDHGGSAVSTDFTLVLDGAPVGPDQPITVVAGVHLVSETGGEGSYEATFSAECPAGSVTLAAGAHVTCTVTNDDLFGLLRVTTSPPLPSQISINGQPADDWAVDWVKVPPGTYTVSFAEVEGWETPLPMDAVVVAGAVTEVAGAFLQHGFLRIVTSPPVPSTLLVDLAPANDWGAWTDVLPGPYEVCFGDVADFSTPPCQVANVTAGATEVMTGDFVSNPGALGPAGHGLLRLETMPAVPSRLRLNGLVANDWGLDWVKLAPGDYAVDYGGVRTFTRPASETATITAGEITVVNAMFEANAFMRVITDPPVPGTIYIDGTPRDDWGLWTDFPAGSYEVCFGPVSGFVAPMCQTPTLTGGALTVVTGAYAAAP